VRRLVLLVSDGILGSSGSGPEACVRVLCDVLVCFLGRSGAGALDGLGNVVCGVLDELLVLILKVRSGIRMPPDNITYLNGIHVEVIKSYLMVCSESFCIV
jgi:hypothetical protein